MCYLSVQLRQAMCACDGSLRQTGCVEQPLLEQQHHLRFRLSGLWYSSYFDEDDLYESIKNAVASIVAALFVYLWSYIRTRHGSGVQDYMLSSRVRMSVIAVNKPCHICAGPLRKLSSMLSNTVLYL